MEKLIYVFWKKPEASAASIRQQMLGAVKEQLQGEGIRGLSVHLADELSDFAQKLRITQVTEPLSGIVSVWLDTALDRAPIEAMLARATARLAGYLVCESVPIVNTRHVARPGERTPGLTTVAFLEKPASMTYDAWLDRWQGHHTQVAIETQSTYLYVQNVVVRPLTEGAPPWTAIVEETFPAEAATDPMIFYAADSKERLQEHQTRMFESVQTFIDLSQLESHPLSPYILKTPW